MSGESFTAALRAELDAVVARYEALVRAHGEALSSVRDRDVEALRGEVAALRAEGERQKAREGELQAEVASLRAKAEGLERELAQAREEAAREREAARAAVKAAEEALEQERKRSVELEAEARVAAEAAQALEGTFAAEKAFVAACGGLEGSMLMEALRAALGQDLRAAPATYGALKARGLDATLAHAARERGRHAAQAPLLDREQRALSGLAAAAGCELIVPATGAKFSASSMDKASTVSDPAEEGNVVQCLVPGIRLAGTDGALVLPRVVVASG